MVLKLEDVTLFWITHKLIIFVARLYKGLAMVDVR